MNWNTFQTHNLAHDKAFETLCNQLFENWCKEKYHKSIGSFNVVNGAGGDGGVESYAVLTTGDIIALQAKWFPSGISSTQIGQIRKSINTALKIRPEIRRYIVCIPRDLTSETAKSKNSEEKRWNNFLDETKINYPELTIELWNDTKITSELQNSNCAGICRFWFEKSELAKETLEFAFERAKNSWLQTKYEPDLNTEGEIEKEIKIYLGNPDYNKFALDKFKRTNELCKEFSKLSAELLLLRNNEDELNNLLRSTNERILLLQEENQKIINWLLNDTIDFTDVDIKAFTINWHSIIEAIKDNRKENDFYFHKAEIIKLLEQLARIDCYDFLKNIPLQKSTKSLLFIGNPGTGKTHGVSAIAEKLLCANLHIPLLINSKDIADEKTWKDIIQSGLRLGTNWSEEELWQGLSSLVNRYRFYTENINSEVKITPKILIIIDGLDEFSTQDKWIERIKETNIISEKFSNIRFCFTTRPLSFGKSYDWVNLKTISSNGDVPVYKLFDSYTKAYNVTAKNSGWIKHALTSPLALKLFCELNKDKTVDYSTYAEVAIPGLWRKKIEIIEKEFSAKASVSIENQYVFKSIVILSELYIENSKQERSILLNQLISKLSISETIADKLLKSLESFGVINCYCECGTGITPNRYFYYSGIQGYFDYATAEFLIDRFSHPENIDFEKCKGIHKDTIYALAIISIQKYDYLITHNKTIITIINEDDLVELQFYALQHTDCKNAMPFVERTREIMSVNASGLITIVNKLILPFSRYEGHPLGVSLLNDFLNSFENPAQRDIMWSIYGYLRNAYGLKWFQDETLELENDEYILNSHDTHNGCPIIYAWALSTINNSMRKLYRTRLMEWAYLAPEEFYELFLNFSSVNDPQIKSELFAILMCVIYECADNQLIEKTTNWLCQNILHPDKIDENRDISIRYYSIAIVMKALTIGIIKQKDVILYLPPYHVEGYNIPLDKNALSGTKMSGHRAIDYDLSRYVLVGHIESAFNIYSYKKDSKLQNLLDQISKKQLDGVNLTSEQFIISAAYAYILKMGWNETEFLNLEKDENGHYIDSVDRSISSTYIASTHGAKSPVMTVCEKYVWQARNYISGFLCDRLPIDNIGTKVTDYGIIDDFSISSPRIKSIDPDNIPTENPWHIPEPQKAILDGVNSCKEDIINNIKNAPEINWTEWLFINKISDKYSLDCENALALSMNSCFFGSSEVETNLFVNSIVINTDDILDFIKLISDKKESSNRVYNPTDWYGGINVDGYITPKEVCWFPWKEYYNSTNEEEFPNINLSSAVYTCTYNSSEFTDICYSIPSLEIREIMKITDTNGYNYYDDNLKAVAEYCIAGEKYGTYQEYLFADKNCILSGLHECNKSLLWIMKERRSESMKSREKYGDLYAEKTRVYIGFFDNEKFNVIKVKDEFIHN